MPQWRSLPPKAERNAFVNFFHPVCFKVALPFSLSPSYSTVAVTQIPGYVAGSSPSLPATVLVLHFYRENILALSSFVDLRRTVLTHARRFQQLLLIRFVFLQICSKSHDGGIRTHGPTLVAFEGYH